MARQIICDICGGTYQESRAQESHKMILNGHSVKVYIDIDTEDDNFTRVDACIDCKKQAIQQVLNGGEA